jgi:hypothetical protein
MHPSLYMLSSCVLHLVSFLKHPLLLLLHPFLLIFFSCLLTSGILPQSSVPHLSHFPPCIPILTSFLLHSYPMHPSPCMFFSSLNIHLVSFLIHPLLLILHHSFFPLAYCSSPCSLPLGVLPLASSAIASFPHASLHLHPELSHPSPCMLISCILPRACFSLASFPFSALLLHPSS